MVTVLCCGCFDALHVGHVAHLQAARAMGDTLIVALTLDNYVNKGPGRPLFRFDERKRMLEALRCVDLVIGHADVTITLLAVRPDIYVKGPDYMRPERLGEYTLCQQLGTRVEVLHTRPVYHTSDIITGALLERNRAVAESVN